MPARGTSASAGSAPRGPDGRWGGRVDWRSWEEGVVRAKEEGRPMMVVVYADWCPRCKALEGVFDEPDVLALSRRLVMIRQDHDEGPPWLRKLDAEHGSYVPRIFFFSSDGRLLKDATSGHPRYPYFYAAEHPEFLKRTMRKVAGR